MTTYIYIYIRYETDKAMVVELHGNITMPSYENFIQIHP